jgi:septal ring factor EnvC (AmiA/AmiB activator)
VPRVGERHAVAAVLAGALCLAPANAAPGDDARAQQTREQIEALEAQITRIAAQQHQREAQRSDLQTQLRRSETRLQAINRELADLRRQIDAASDELTTLLQRQGDLEAAAAAQRDAVAEELRRAWRGGGTDQLKLLLSQEDPQVLARLLAYYRYVLGARNRLLDEYAVTLGELTTLEADVAGRRERLEAQRATVAERRQQLSAEQRRRRQLLVDIESQLAAGSARLEAARTDREALEQLLLEIEAALASIDTIPDARPFSAARGDMPWPVEGRITHRFGLPRAQGKLRWQGMRLRAEAGTTVQAIHGGRVVYADWLRGSGLLLVIDHGEGYMSLYAHNETLLREVGDWVGEGAPISTVGDSGGQGEPALYFEIRKDGKPVDPQRWCRG